MSNVNNVLKEAQIASRAHFSTADSAWRLKQLHGLYRLIVDTRDELIASLAEGDGLTHQDMNVRKLTLHRTS